MMGSERANNEAGTSHWHSVPLTVRSGPVGEKFSVFRFYIAKDRCHHP